MSEEWTIKRMLHWSDDFLGRHGSTSPRLDAELLLGEALSMRRLDLYMHFDRPLQTDELAAYKALVRRRSHHEPVAYILGRKGFHAIELAVGEGVLVPRPETESLVDQVLAFAAADDAPAGPVLDLCTGSGAIALALAAAWLPNDAPRAIAGTDISETCLDWARRNQAEVAPRAPIDWRLGDLYDATAASERFAIIVSNPPYVRRDVLAQLEPTVRDHEPALALDGGEEGLDVLLRIIKGAGAHLLPGGLLALELGSRAQGEAVVAAATDVGMVAAAQRPVGPGPTAIVTARAPASSPTQSSSSSPASTKM